MPVPRSLVLAAFALALTGCGHTAPSTEHTLASWTPTVTPDSTLALRVPAEYARINASGCWSREDPVARWPRQFCLVLHRPEAAAYVVQRWSVPCTGPASSAGDAACYDSVRVDTLAGAGQRRIVRRGLLTGTIGHYRQQPALSVEIPFDSAGTALLSAEVRGRETASELLSIAETVRLGPRLRLQQP
jgi:hypothetical protein